MDIKTTFPGIPDILADFLEFYANTYKRSDATIYGYYYDLRLLFRYVKKAKKLCKASDVYSSIDISDVSIGFVQSITLNELKNFQRLQTEIGAYPSVSCIRRRTSAIRSFYTYLNIQKKVLDKDISVFLDMPKAKKQASPSLTDYQCTQILKACADKFRSRDYAIILLFLSCGCKISELAALNITDIHEDCLVLSPANGPKRFVYINAACRKAIDDYLDDRDQQHIHYDAEQALFISQKNVRFTVRGIQQMIYRTVKAAGLDPDLYSAQNLRNTSAKKMLSCCDNKDTVRAILGQNSLQSFESAKDKNKRQMKNIADSLSFHTDGSGKS